MAAGVSVAAHRAGLTIPDDLSIGGFDDTAAAELAWPALTTIHQPLREMAEAATILAIEQVLPGGRTDEPKGAKLPYRLIIRESTAPPRAPAGRSRAKRTQKARQAG